MMANKEKETIIYLDVDGPLAGFVEASCRLFGQDVQELYARWPAGKRYGSFWELFDRQLTAADFWQEIDNQGNRFEGEVACRDCGLSYSSFGLRYD